MKDSNYRALAIGTVSEIFCATPLYLQQHEQLMHTNDLIKHHIIATSWQKSSLAIYKNDVMIENNPVINYFAKTNTLPSALEMVLHDMGIALLPEFVVQSYITSGCLVRVLPEYQGWQWPFYMIHRFHGEKPIHITRFYQLVKHYFSKVNTKI